MIQVNRSRPSVDITEQGIFGFVGGDDSGSGHAAFAALVEAFYEGIATDPVIRPMYPEELAGARERLTLFLIQYFGGPTTYSNERGHPRLRMRHAAFHIDEAARDAWLTHMNAALDKTPVFAPVADMMRAYFQNAANFLVNR